MPHRIAPAAVVLLASVASVLVVSSVAAEDRQFDDLANRVPLLRERLHSTRWEVRYGLLGELYQRDEATKRALELLVRDEHPMVANQALVRYVQAFVIIDKTLFRASSFTYGRFPLPDLPAGGPDRALVEYCLGKRDVPKERRPFTHDLGPVLTVLDPSKADQADMYDSLTIVGILGTAEDAKALYPFLESTNDYVVWGAAKALLRLGDNEKALEAMVRLLKQDPRQHLHYMTEALCVLKEAQHPRLKELVIEAVSALEATEGIQPNWVSEFLLQAAEVVPGVLE